MPKRPSNAYDEDDGFVAGEGSDEGRGSKSKKARTERVKRDGGRVEKGGKDRKERGKSEGKKGKAGKGEDIVGGGKRD